MRFVRPILALALMTAATAVQAENWPSWRGPTSNGISNEKNVPAKWGRDENVAWRLALPGDAGATPVVWGNRLFLTSEDGGNLVLLCANTAGKELWRRKVGSGNQRIRGDEGNLASPSPCTDGTHVWTMFGTGDLACFDFDGNEVWHINLICMDAQTGDQV